MELTVSTATPLVSAFEGPTHLVQFYDQEIDAGPIARFLADGLAAGEAAVVIATAEHRQQIADALAALGDGGAPGHADRFILLDAAETLAALSDEDGKPTVEGLRRHVGTLLVDLASRYGGVRAYGEMVDLLARAGRIDAAIALETAWNDLLATLPVRLLCGYELGAFDHDAHGQGFRRVCALHSRVAVSAEDATAAPDRDRLIAELQHQTRLARLGAEQAERASRAKDEFLAMLGHELRNPLSPIVTALHLMKLRGSGELERERALIERQVSHLLRLVEDLLDVSRITRGKLQLERRAVELAEVVAQAIETVGPLVAQRSHRLVVDVRSDGLVVDGDPVRLAQVMTNLLSNAAKYTPSEGRIEVRSTIDGDDAVVTIRDNGLGIAPELLPTVFDLFVQGPRAHDRAEGGLGLGLAIVNSLVQLHGGSVSVASEGIGKGAEFRVRLPLASRSSRSRGSAAASTQRSHGRGLRVLVVDDNLDAAETLAELLSAMGCEAHVAHDGPAAVLAAVEQRPQLVVLDLGLPIMDGYEVASRLRSSGFDRLHVVALTGYGQPEDRERSRRAGFDAHFVKPLAPEALQALIASVEASERADGQA